MEATGLETRASASSAINTTHKPDFSIPVINMDEPDDEKLAKLISKASSENGVFQVVNHGVPKEVMAKLQGVGRQFFELPKEDKELYARPDSGSTGEGYGSKTSTDKVAWCDHLLHKLWPLSAVNYRFWPKTPASYREANEEYAKHIRCLSDTLFRCLSLGLGLQAHELKAASGGEDLEYVLMINYYPPSPGLNHLALGVPPHTDMCAMTLLMPNQVPGLQLCRDDHWYDVEYVPNAIIIHIGDQLEIMSNGEYKSMLHRTTLDKERTRMSWPVFLNPPLDHTVGPIPALISQEKPAKYKSKKYGDYMDCKMKGLPQ